MYRRKTLLVFAILAVVFLILLTGAMASDDHGLTGSWMVAVNPEGGFPPFVNLSTMTHQGRVINVNTDGLTSVGEWAHSGPRSFTTTFWGLETADGVETRYEVRGDLTVSLDGKTFEGPFQTDFFDGDGNPLFTISGTVKGQRLYTQSLSEPPSWP